MPPQKLQMGGVDEEDNASEARLDGDDTETLWAIHWLSSFWKAD